MLELTLGLFSEHRSNWLTNPILDSLGTIKAWKVKIGIRYMSLYRSISFFGLSMYLCVYLSSIYHLFFALSVCIYLSIHLSITYLLPIIWPSFTTYLSSFYLGTIYLLNMFDVHEFYSQSRRFWRIYYLENISSASVCSFLLYSSLLTRAVLWFKVQSHLFSFHLSNIFGEESKDFCPTCSAFTVFLCFTFAVSFNFTSCEWAWGGGLKRGSQFSQSVVPLCNEI